MVVTSMGFVAADNRVVTAFQAVDGSSSLRLTFSDRRTTETRELVSWNRWQDWAIVPAAGAKARFPMVAAREWQVGDRVFSLALSPDRGLTIVDTAIVGMAHPDRAGERITISASDGPHTTGAPVLTEYGDVIGVVAGQTVPGASSLPRPMTGPSATEGLAARAGGYVVPADLVRGLNGATTTTFEKLRADGQFVPLLGAGRIHVARATTAQGAVRGEIWVTPSEEKAVFSKREGALSLILNVRPKAKIRLTANCRVFDLDGRLLSEGKPTLVKGDTRDTASVTWKIDPSQTAPGLYRLDIVFDGEPVWRTFIKINP